LIREEQHVSIDDIDVQAIDAIGTIIGFGEKSSSCCQ
jgi:hypothetical protein